jgi:hypothetical protein
MATYVPGAETYLPDIKPFTPDYKILSAVLDVRQDKYNTNWKATNDLYNKVVYADLSRTDTKEQRNQYINQIAPSLEKISGMDLSMVQNVDSAKAVFAPFFEDDLIVSDIMHTSNYRKEMDYANRLIDSPDQKQREKYSQDGVKGLQYHMEDFIGASADKAMKMGLPKFVEDADLMELAQQTLGEMKPPLKMKVDHYGTNPDGSVNTDWIITEQNGNLVTGPALQYIQKALLDDPRVVRHYQNQAFVRGRDFAAEGMASGIFTTKEEGQAAWASETINRITQQNDYYLKKDIKALANAEDVNVRWDNYQLNNGIVPGSDDEKAMLGEKSSYEATKAALDAKYNIQKTANTPVKDFGGTLNKAYNLLMQNNISKDMQAAAQVYGARDMEYTMKVNEYAKQQKQFQFDMAKIEAQGQNSINLANVKGKIDYDLAKAKGEIVPTEETNPVLKAAKGINVSVGGAQNSTLPVDAEGNITSNPDMNLQLVDDFTKLKTKIRDEQLNVVAGILTFLNPAGEIDNSGKPTQKYTVKIAGQDFTGTINQVKNKLGERFSNGVYKYRDDLQTLYNQQSKILNDPKQMAKYPGKAETKTYTDLYQQIYSDQGINTRNQVVDQEYITLQKDYKKSHDQAVVFVKGEDSSVKDLMEKGGMPGIYRTTATGIPVQMSKKEYIEAAITQVRKGKITNVNLSSVFDTGTNNKDYMHWGNVPTGKPYKVRGGGTEIVYEVERKWVLDENAVKTEAGLVYDKLKARTNEIQTGKVDNITAPGTLYGRLNGASGVSGIAVAPVYRAPIDPLSSTVEGQTLLAQMMTQKNMLDSQGEGYSIVLGDLSDKKDSKSIVNDPLALKAYNAYVADMLTWLGNDKRSNSANIAPRGRITYSGTLGAAGEGNKTTGGYVLDDFKEWAASKIKGSATEASGAEGEYGLFSKSEVAQLQKGITMVFDKKYDINPRSAKSQYYSKTLAAIQASPDQFVQYEYPGIDGMTPTATYRIVKTGTDQFYATYKYNTYQPNGTYKESGWQQAQIQTGSFNNAESIDEQVKYLQSQFEMKRRLNLEDHNRNSAVKGVRK